MTTPRYLPEVGGVEHYVYQVARRLVQQGVSVTVLTTDVSRTLPPNEVRDGIRIRRVPAWPARRDYHFAPRIFTEITRGEWDIVHVQSYHTFVAPIAMLAARRAGLPYVLTFHGGGHSSRLRNLVRRSQRRALRSSLARADRLIALAQFEVDLYGTELRLPRGRFAVIPIGTDLAPPIDARDGHSTQTLIASVGRLEKYKGHQRLIAALPRILQGRPDARVWLAGSGPYESDLRRLADRLGVSERVQIASIPVGERERMARELSKASLVVLLSEYETQPAAVLEALALGRPALVADTSGLSELAQRGLARAVPLESTPEDIAAAVLEELERPHVTAPPDLPTWDDCASALLGLYRSVLGKRRRQGRPGSRLE
jgi:glycosyltransferase involved in cell wall biosynthesis